MYVNYNSFAESQNSIDLVLFNTDLNLASLNDDMPLVIYIRDIAFMWCECIYLLTAQQAIEQESEMDGAIKSEPRMSMQAAEDDDGKLISSASRKLFWKGGLIFLQSVIGRNWI